MSAIRPRDWGSFTTAQLPNVAGATVQSSALRVGDASYDTTIGAGVICTTATVGAAVYAVNAQGGNGSGGLPQLHDTTHTPVSLWQLNNSYADSGTAGETLVLAAGTDVQSPGSAPSFSCNTFDGASRLGSSGVAAASLRILTGVTVEALVRPGDSAALVAGVIAQVSGDMGSETEANNALWEMRFTDQSALSVSAFWERGAGINEILTAAIWSPNRFMWNHLAFTRDTTGGIGATVTKIYVNGALAASSSVMSPPTGGSSAVVRIGGGNIAATFMRGGIASVKVIAAVLTQAQIQDEVRRTLSRSMWGF